jgi:hypothetical protein
MVGITSSPVKVLTHLWPGHLSRHLEPPVRRQARQGDEGARSEKHACNLDHGGYTNQVVRENVRDVCFQKRCRAPNNTVKYDGKMNPNIWIEDYCLACRAGGADDDLFIIQFIPIYLVDKVRAWLDHLRRNIIDRWDNLKEIFTDNFQGTYVRSSNQWDLKCCRQKPDESLRDYIWQFSRKCHKLPKIVDADYHTWF